MRLIHRDNCAMNFFNLATFDKGFHDTSNRLICNFQLLCQRQHRHGSLHRYSIKNLSFVF